MRAFFVFVPAFIAGVASFGGGILAGFSPKESLPLAGLLFALFAGIGLSATKARPDRGEGNPKAPATEGEA